jgi:DNA-binding transcriptional regulator YbjK
MSDIEDVRGDIESVFECAVEGMISSYGMQEMIDLLNKYVAAVREDERQKMYDLWKGMLP